MPRFSSRTWTNILHNWLTSQLHKPQRRRGSRTSSIESLEDRVLLSAGTLDPSFGDGGQVTTDIGWPASNRAEDAVAYQSDGKLIVATNAPNQFVAVRYESNGALDPSFGVDGMARVDFPGATVTASLVVDEFDNIILAGSFRNGTDYNFAVARLSPDGTLDTSFDGDGIATIDFGGTYDIASAVTLDGAGRIVVGGSTNQSTVFGYDFAVARLNSNGSLDLTFDVDGRQTVDFASLYDDLWALETDHLNRVVMVGRTAQLHSGGGSDIGIARLTEAGQLDTGFNGDGLIRWDLGSTDSGFDVAIYGTGADERIVVTGSTNGLGVSHQVVLRLDGNGDFDETFDSDGVQFTNRRSFGTSVAVDASQRILVAGYATFSGQSYNWVVTRLLPSGEVDDTFGIDGTQTIDFDGGFESTPHLAIDSAGNILVSGWLRRSQDDIGLARLTSDGSLDLSFGTDGKVQTDVRREGTEDEARDIVAYQSDGKMVVLGSIGPGNPEIGVLRYNVDGSLDQTFGINGINRFEVGDADYPQSLTIDGQGRIIIGGYSWFRDTQNTRDDFSIVRLTADGNLDTTFNGTGTWSMDFGTNGDRAYVVTVDSENRILLAGTAGLVRVTESGTLDATWGTGGIQPTAPGSVRGISFDSAGRILIAGTGSTQATRSDFAVMRLSAAGNVDITYGDGGLKLVDIDGTYNSLTDFVLDDQGRAVVVGTVGSTASSQDFGIARLTPEGQIDTSFNGTGYQRVDFSGARDIANGVALDSNRRIVVVGMTDTESATGVDFGAVRFFADGTLDHSFGIGGKQTIDFGNTYDVGNAVMVDASDRVVIVGTSEQPGLSGSDIALVRLLSNEAPTANDTTLSVAENTQNGTSVGTVSASDPDGDPLTYSILTGNDLGAFAVDATTGEISVADSTKLDYESATLPKVFTLEVQVDDGQGGTDTAAITINLLNQASITGTVFVDVNFNRLFDGNEMGIDGVTVELRDASDAVVASTVTSDGGFYLFEDFDPGTYRIHEVQPTGVDDGAEILGTIDGMVSGTILPGDLMKLTLNRKDASDYDFAELGQQVTSGDTAGIGFWQNKHGQDLISQGGTALAQWLSDNFSNVFGGEFVDENSVADVSGSDVAAFYKDQLFKQKSKKSVAGPAKVDAQFMAVALATFFTSRNLAGEVAAPFGFNVTDTGIGTRIANVGTSGAAFGADNHTDLTIMQLLSATNNLTGVRSGFSYIYDVNGDGILSPEEEALRNMANLIFSLINEQDDL